MLYFYIYINIYMYIYNIFINIYIWACKIVSLIKLLFDLFVIKVYKVKGKQVIYIKTYICI